jgi:O-antigen ligase
MGRALETRGFEEDRLLLYRRGLELFLQNPLTGVGLDNYNVAAGLGSDSHSEYLDVLVGTGVVGAVLYFSIYVLLWRRLGKIARARPAPEIHYQVGVYRAIVITWLLLGLGTPHYLDPYGWILIAAMIGSSSGIASWIDPGCRNVGGVRG